MKENKFTTCISCAAFMIALASRWPQSRRKEKTAVAALKSGSRPCGMVKLRRRVEKSRVFKNAVNKRMGTVGTARVSLSQTRLKKDENLDLQERITRST